MLKISTFEKKFIDSEGRERIFNGVNLCDKGYYDPAQGKRIYELPFSEELISTLSKLGFNLVRLGITLTDLKKLLICVPNTEFISSLICTRIFIQLTQMPVTVHPSGQALLKAINSKKQNLFGLKAISGAKLFTKALIISGLIRK